jgi:hypothetical protein
VNLPGDTRDVFVGWLNSNHTSKIVIVEPGQHDYGAKMVERRCPDITWLGHVVV